MSAHPGLTPQQDQLLRDAWHPCAQAIIRDLAARIHALETRERSVLSTTPSLSARIDTLERYLGSQGVMLLQRVTALETAQAPAQPAPAGTPAEAPVSIINAWGKLEFPDTREAWKERVEILTERLKEQEDELSRLRAEVERLTKELGTLKEERSDIEDTLNAANVEVFASPNEDGDELPFTLPERVEQLRHMLASSQHDVRTLQGEVKDAREQGRQEGITEAADKLVPMLFAEGFSPRWAIDIASRLRSGCNQPAKEGGAK
jgi:archaellum component FlaC